MSGASLARLQAIRAAHERLRVDALIATVGSNPLPIAVTARLVLRPGGSLTLVHTQATAAVAHALEGLLGPRYDGFTVDRVLVPDSDPQRIYELVHAVAASLPADAAVGLDYTGGTKAMSVFAAYAVDRALGHRSHWSFYLDARSDRLRAVLNEPDGRRTEPVIDVGRLPLLELEEVLVLHGFEPQGALTPPDERLTRTAQKLAEILAQPAVAKRWRRWVKQLESYRTGPGRPWRDRHPEQVDKQWDWSVLAAGPTLLRGLVQTIEEESGVRIDRNTAPNDMTAALGWPEGEFLAWLHGRWLEQHTFAALRQLPIECGLRPRGASMKAWLYAADVTGSYAADPATEFEVDVLASRGYRLWGFSCTTSDWRGTCKTKLFEACHRMAQLGGAESRTVLVAAFRSPHELEQQVETLFHNHAQAWAFGAADLPRLAERLEERLTGS